MLCILTEILSGAHPKGQKSYNDFRFCTSISRFASDGAASMAEKGLKKQAIDFYRILKLLQVRWIIRHGRERVKETSNRLL